MTSRYEAGKAAALRQANANLPPHTDAASCAPDQGSEESAFFDCNICHDTASNAVVTLCGHLYCWGCIYRWMELRNRVRLCPVCKAGIDTKSCIPIYGRGSGNQDPRTSSQTRPTSSPDDASSLPDRPAGQRPPPQDQGFFSNLRAPRSIFYDFRGSNSGGGGVVEPLTPEQRHEAFMSRFLLVLGSFVIMCLLLF